MRASRNAFCEAALDALKKIDKKNVRRRPGCRGIFKNRSDVNFEGSDKSIWIARKKRAKYLCGSLVGAMNNSIDVKIEFKCMINNDTEVANMSYFGNWIIFDEILMVIFYVANG